MTNFIKILAVTLPLGLVAQSQHSLKFNPENYTIQTLNIEGKEISFRAYQNIVYVSHPVEPDYQNMNIYIPVEYFSGKSIGNFTAKNAPIFFPNNVGGYMPAKAGVAGLDDKSGKHNAIAIALSKGYVVASPGARGRTLQQENGQYTDKAPAAIIDLKAAVRYLKFNDKRMPGDAEKIISNGTSAGGALSALLGATGNHKDYAPYLKEIGSAKAKDDIFAVSAYCPITNLDNADAAYEWQFNGVNDYQMMSVSMLDYHVERKLVPGTLTEHQAQLSHQLKSLFPQYVNSLNLKGADGIQLGLDTNGEGSFKTLVGNYILQSAQSQLHLGNDLSDVYWLKIHNGKAIGIDFSQYAQTAGRQKTPPAFDGTDLKTGENQLFGTSTIDKQHFTDFAQNHSTESSATRADKKIVKMMNPMYYIGEKTAKTSHHWRIRHGTNDRDTSLAIPVILATKLENTGKSVDFALPWNQGHGGDYDLDELFDWISEITQ